MSTKLSALLRETDIEAAAKAHGMEEGLTGMGQDAVGISFRTSDEYAPPEAHNDEECFYVLAGLGFALVDGEEIELSPGCAFKVLPGQLHSVKKHCESEHIKLLWFHRPPTSECQLR